MNTNIDDLTLHQINIFLTVARTKSFSKAADLLFLTQPTISKSISKLEKFLGLSLFVRTTRKMELTDEGKHLFEKWSMALQLIKDSYGILAEESERNNKTVRIAVAGNTDLDLYFWPIVKTFLKKHPTADLHIHNDSIFSLVKHQITDSADIIIVPDFLHYQLVQMGFSWKYAAINNVIILVPKGSPFFHREFLTLEEIHDQPFICMEREENDCYTRYVSELFQQEGYTYGPPVKRFKNELDVKNMYHDFKDALYVIDDFFHQTNAEYIKEIPLQNYYNGMICAWKTPFRNTMIQHFIHGIHPPKPHEGKLVCEYNAPEVSEKNGFHELQTDKK